MASAPQNAQLPLFYNALEPLSSNAHAAFRQLVADCAEIDTNAVTFWNPFLTFIKMKVSTAINVVPAHARRHVWQAANVVSSLRSRGTMLNFEC